MSIGVIAAHDVIGGGGGTGYSGAVLARSPSAYYRLAEPSGTVMTDSSGNSHDGTYVGSPNLNQATLLSSEPSDKSVGFTGTNRGATAYGSWLDSPTALTLVALVKPTLLTSSRPIMDRDNSSGRVWQWYMTSTALVFIKIGGTGGVVTGAGSFSFSTSTIYHVAATYDGASIRLYVGGSLIQTTAAAGTLGTGNSPLYVGESYQGTASPASAFVGQIDEPAIFPSVLTTAQIAALAAAA